MKSSDSKSAKIETNREPPLEFDSLSSDSRHQRGIAHDLCAAYNRSPGKGNLKKILSLMQACGNGVVIERGFHCDYGKHISLGDRVYLNINCTLLDGGKISIGSDCLIGPNVQILTINHPLSANDRLQKLSLAQDVSVGKNVWIGAGAIILPGVRVGDNVVIGAGSIVTCDLESNSLYVGSPARKIRELE